MVECPNYDQAEGKCKRYDSECVECGNPHEVSDDTDVQDLIDDGLWPDHD